MRWFNLRAAARYVDQQDSDLPEDAAEKPRRGRSPRLLAREIKAGRLRAARIGGKGEYITCPEWCDAWLEDLARPVAVAMRRRA